VGIEPQDEVERRARNRETRDNSRQDENCTLSDLVIVPGGDHGLAHARAADVLPHIERHLRQI
jgi:hypothetical protein